MLATDTIASVPTVQFRPTSRARASMLLGDFCRDQLLAKGREVYVGSDDIVSMIAAPAAAGENRHAQMIWVGLEGR